jgi:hypothetical protein
MIAQRVSRSQRFKSGFPCPVCGGGENDKRGQSTRDWGFLSEDGSYAICTNQAFAGGLPLNPKTNGYHHHLDGPCRCGVDHSGTTTADTTRTRKETPPEPQRGPFPAIHAGAKLAAVYDYHDAQGVRTFSVLRYEHPLQPGETKPDKTFLQARWIDADTWVMGLGETERTLFRLGALNSSPADTRPVFIPEGEACALAVEALGLVATTSSGGAGKWGLTPGRHEALRGRHVVILPDNDLPGAVDSAQRAADLAAVAASVRVLKLPDLRDLPDHGDVGDWIASGGDAKTLLELAMTTPVYTVPSAENEESSPRGQGDFGDESAHNLHEWERLRWMRETMTSDEMPTPYKLALIAEHDEYDAKYLQYGVAYGEPIPVFVADIAARYGVSAQSAGEHLRKLNEWEGFSYHTKPTVNKDGMPRMQAYIAPTPLTMTPHEIKPPSQRNGLGGARPGAGRKCKSCGSTNLEIVCRNCGAKERLEDTDEQPETQESSPESQSDFGEMGAQEETTETPSAATASSPESMRVDRSNSPGMDSGLAQDDQTPLIDPDDMWARVGHVLGDSPAFHVVQCPGRAPGNPHHYEARKGHERRVCSFCPAEEPPRDSGYGYA